MITKYQLLLVCVLSTVTHLTFASHKTASNWAGSNASFGLNINTGDTKTINVNFGGVAKYNYKTWSQNLNVTYQLAYTDSAQTKGIFNGTENLNYYFKADKKTFASGNMNVISDISSAYRYTVVGSAMYGQSLYKNNKFEWDAQIGPGMRYNAPYTGEEGYSRPVLVLLSNFSWTISSWGTLTENLRYEYGKPYNFFQTTTNLTNKLSGHLALQLSFQLDHYSSLPKFKNVGALTNTTTTASIVYNF